MYLRQHRTRRRVRKRGSIFEKKPPKRKPHTKHSHTPNAVRCAPSAHRVALSPTTSLLRRVRIRARLFATLAARHRRRGATFAFSSFACHVSSSVVCCYFLVGCALHPRPRRRVGWRGAATVGAQPSRKRGSRRRGCARRQTGAAGWSRGARSTQPKQQSKQLLEQQCLDVERNLVRN